MGIEEIIGLATALGPLLKLYTDSKAAALQSGDVTDADRAALAAAEEAAFGSHAWKTDDQGGM